MTMNQKFGGLIPGSCCLHIEVSYPSGSYKHRGGASRSGIKTVKDSKGVQSVSSNFIAVVTEQKEEN